MIFASTPPINDDLTPYEYPSGVRSMFSEGDGMKLTYRPDPEFNRPRAHEENPILSGFRLYRQHKDVVPGSVAEYWLFAITAFEVFGGYRDWEREDSPFHSFTITIATVEHIDHARRVISRFASIIGRN